MSKNQTKTKTEDDSVIALQLAKMQKQIDDLKTERDSARAALALKDAPSRVGIAKLKEKYPALRYLSVLSRTMLGTNEGGFSEIATLDFLMHELHAVETPFYMGFQNARTFDPKLSKGEILKIREGFAKDLISRLSSARAEFASVIVEILGNSQCPLGKSNLAGNIANEKLFPLAHQDDAQEKSEEARIVDGKK